MRKQFAAMVGVISVLVAASVGLAATGEPNSLLTEGYDSDNHTLVWGVADHPDSEDFEGTLDCRLVTGSYDYEADEDGKVVVLTDEEGAPVQYVPAEGGDPTDDTEGECSLTATNVEGPNGQVNHGSVISSFVHDLKAALKALGIRGAGCYVRLIAQSEYGKGDQQVQVPDVEEPEEGEVIEAEPVEGTVDLTTHETTCGKPDHAGQGGPPEGKGKPDHAGQGGPPEHAGQGGPPEHAQGRGRP
ncbi:MAG TPA: hypothetical protein VFT54_02865 [Acidimicrobiia bacterium]|nr:hypothetical protein [Acidimicrobiia bacterium]